MNIGDKVRNVKTRVVGELTGLDGDNAVMHVDTDFGKAPRECRVDDLELLNVEEFQLVKSLADAIQRRKDADAVAETAKSEAAAAEDALLEYLRTNSLEATKGYEGIGVAKIDGMKVMPRINKENEAEAFAALRAMGRGEVIKETIHSATLAALVGELIDTGVKVPESIPYFLKPKLKITKK